MAKRRRRERVREGERGREGKERKLSTKKRREADQSAENSRGSSYGYTTETYLINQPTDQPFIDRCNPSHVASIQTGYTVFVRLLACPPLLSQSAANSRSLDFLSEL